MMKSGYILTALVALCCTTPAMARDLTVVSWGGVFQDAQREVYFTPFSETTGIPLIEDSWDGGIGVLRAKINAGEANNWDVVQVEAEEEFLGCEEGLFELLDPAEVGGVELYIPGTLTPCGTPANVFSMILAYDGDTLSEGPKSWADVFDTVKFPGKRAFRSGPKMNLEYALLADGVAPADVYPLLSSREGIDRAFAKLDSIKQDIVWWTSGNQPMQLLGSGEVVMTTSYNGRIDAANRDNNRHFQIMWEGNIFVIDSWVVLKNSPLKENAIKLVEFLGRTDRQVKWPEKLGYGVGNVEAQQQLPDALAATLPTSPEHLAQSLKFDGGFWVKNIDRLNERFAVWAAQ